VEAHRRQDVRVLFAERPQRSQPSNHLLIMSEQREMPRYMTSSMSRDPIQSDPPEGAVDLPRFVLPTVCGRYTWADEPVTVRWDDGELVAVTSAYIDTPGEIDRMFRDENAEENQTSPELPWALVSECCDDECSGHDANRLCQKLEPNSDESQETTP
jgi:hypothetical protein